MSLRRARAKLGKSQPPKRAPPRTAAAPVEEEEGGGEGRGSSILFPLDYLLPEVLRQEELLWQRNHLVLQALRGPDSSAPVSSPEQPRRPSPSSPSSTPPLPPHAPLLPAASQEPDMAQQLFLIRYGRLVDSIHAYFRRLEKQHACLYLTGRKALHDSLRRVEVSGRPSDSDAAETLSAGVFANTEGRRLTILKDEELLVYRCALMCSQFPMLSAPSPPPGHSPTPTPPIFGSNLFSNLGSLDIAHTAPADTFLGRMGPDASGADKPAATTPPSSDPPEAHTQDRDSLKVAETVEEEEEKENGDALKLTETMDTARGGEAKQRPTPPDDRGIPPEQWAGHPAVPVSEPIVIKTGVRGRGRVGGRGEGGWRKRVSESLVDDSGEEEEVAQLTAGKLSGRLGSLGLAPPRDQPFSPMVNREMLCMLVRRAFVQTEEQQLQFEQILRHEYGRRSKGEILAKELAAQLQVLENNAHTFYKPKHFVTRNGYDQWLHAEKQRIRGLIDKFWHFSLPRPQLWRHYNPTDYHRAFSILLQRIVGCESLTERRESVLSGRTPSKPLSPTAQRLLLEFGLRYGVGELYRKIVYLDYLAKHFDYEIWYIRHCTDELRHIRSMLPRNRNRVTAVRREMDLLRATVHLLHGQADNSLTRIDRLFNDSDPREGVACLIELLAEVLDAEQSLFGKKVHPAEDWLKRYLKSGFVLRYERSKEIAADETVQVRAAQPFVITPVLVNAMLLRIRDEVAEYREKFQPVFRPYFDIVPFAKLEFYRLLCADACSLCLRMIHRPETRQLLSLEMLGLMYRLNERDLEWEAVVTPEMQLWRNHFADLALLWLEVMGRQLSEWVLASIAKDEWTMFSFAMERTRGSVTLSSGSPSATQLRPSPFPSPSLHLDSAFSPLSFGGSRGAFMPYHRPHPRPHPQNPVSPPASETSGAVTDISSGTSSSVESLVGTSLATTIPGAGLGPQSPAHKDIVLSFSKLESSSECLPATATATATEVEVEVSVSAYQGFEPYADSSEGVQRSQDLAGSAAEDCYSVWPAGQEGGHGREVAERDSLEEITFLFSPVHAGPANGVLRSIAELQEGEEDGVEEGVGEEDGEEGWRGLELASAGLGAASAAAEGQPSSAGPAPQEGSGLGSDGVPLGAAPATDTTTSGLQPDQASSTATSQSGVEGGPVVRFGNLLDGCAAPGAGVVRPKARAPGAGVVRPKAHAAAVTVFNGRAEPQNSSAAARQFSPPPPPDTPPATRVTPPITPTIITISHAAVEDLHDTPSSSPDQAHPSPDQADPSPDQADPPVGKQGYLFPVSNSPLDLITMLTRMASFTGVLLAVLSPKLRQGTVAHGDYKECGSEVASARRQASQQLRFAEEMRTGMLKKLHKGMVSCLRLYADNLLCMDLCGWSSGEATALLGEQVVHHLRRRKEAKEVWGCRHMVEQHFGMHPHGLPCHKKHSAHFESITRDMCIRVNNLHTIISVLSGLESHLLEATKTETQKPASAFGYVSSDPQSPLLPRKPRPLINSHSRLLSSEQPTTSTHLTPSADPDPWLGSLGEERGGRERRGVPEAGFFSQDSLHLLDYLKNVQSFQVKLLCLRMNKFFKPALSLLLELRLGDCSIDKRLRPLVTFLGRHRTALKRYIYPECFSKIILLLWKHILQDLEEEALKLRSAKKAATGRAHMLLRTLSHLIKFMHDRGNGIPLDHLSASSEYLQGLLDLMTRSTEQLISTFNKLASPQFAQGGADLRHTRVTLDTSLLHALRARLHAYNKCFSGQTFVDTLVDLGRHQGTRPLSDSRASTPVPLGGCRGRGTSAGQVLSPTGQPIMYTVHYASEVAQVLLNERVLLPLSSMAPPPGAPPSSSAEASLELAAGLESSLDGAAFSRSQRSSASLVVHRATPTHQGPALFQYSSQLFYKFASAEDNEDHALLQTQVLTASAGGVAGSGLEEFRRAQTGTLFLVHDLLLQRVRRDKRVKQFLQTHGAVTVAERRRQQTVGAEHILRI